MIITNIIEISKKQCKIMLDEEFAFVLYKGELPLYQIKEGETMSKETYHKIVDEVLTRRARLRAMNLLKSRSYTEKKLMDKLKSDMYPQCCIHNAIEYVKSFGYVNDEQYAADYMFYHGSRLNQMQLYQKLREKGVSEEIIQKNYDAYCDHGNAPKEEELIRRFLQKKGYRDGSDGMTDIQKAKLMKSLVQRGFSYDRVRRVLADYGEIAEEMYK